MDGKACVLYCMSGAVQRGKPLAQCPFRLFGTSPSRRLPFSALRAARRGRTVAHGGWCRAAAWPAPRPCPGASRRGRPLRRAHPPPPSAHSCQTSGAQLTVYMACLQSGKGTTPRATRRMVTHAQLRDNALTYIKHAGHLRCSSAPSVQPPPFISKRCQHAER